VTYASFSRAPQGPRTGAFLLLGLAVLAVCAVVLALAFSPRQPAEATLSGRPGDLATAERVTLASLTDYWRRVMPRKALEVRRQEGHLPRHPW
jgi:hypothetical protein